MPSGKTIKPPSKFAFVTREFEAKDKSWLNLHSSAARSHAAYWGGSAKYQGQGKDFIAGGPDNTTTSGSISDKDSRSCDDESDALAALTVQHRRSTKPKNAKGTSSSFKAGCRGPTKPKKAKSISLFHKAESAILPHIEPDNLLHLPSVPSGIRAMDSPSAACLSIFDFCGQGFVKKFVMLDHEDFSIMFSGCQLLAYAHSMALTGDGTNTVLLELKSQVIRRIRTKMKSSDGFLSPRSLTAILALGAPIVCLVSQDLPKRLSIREYINASMLDYSLCCQDSADVAHRALDERIVHRQALYRLFLKSSSSCKDADSLALLQFVSNCVNISMTIELPNHLKNPLDVGDIFLATSLCENCSIPAEWTSPLTCQWLHETSTTHPETQILLLSRLMHRWLRTFLDSNGYGLVPTKIVLEERESLRQSMEGFLPVAKTSIIESEAMYECCRWASSILLAVEKLSIPINLAAKIIRIQPRLVARLRMTNLSNLWGVHKGLLFWVTAVCHISTAEQCFPLLCTALLARFGQEVAMSDCCSEIAIKPWRRLMQFENLCCHPELTSHAIAAHSSIPVQAEGGLQFPTA